MIYERDVDTLHFSEGEFIAVLRMLVRRATWLDKWRARQIPNYWLNAAKRQILTYETLHPPIHPFLAGVK